MQQNNEMEIDLKELFFVLWNKAILIALVSIMCGLGVFIFTKFFVTPIYESTTKVYVYNKQTDSNMSVSDLQLGAQLTKDYKEIIVCRPVLEKVITKLGLNTTYNELKNTVAISTPTDTRILGITVSHENPEAARVIADSIREVAAEHIMKVMDIQAVNTVEEANTALSPSKPSTAKNTLIGLVLGAFITVFIILVRHLLNDTIKSPEDIEKYLGLSTLASIPVIETVPVNDKKTQKKKR